MRHFALAALTALAPLPALAELDLSTELADTGIAATLGRLHALPVPDADAQFAIGGLEFLAAVERSYQLAATYGKGSLLLSPFNGPGRFDTDAPSKPFSPDIVEQSLDDTLAAMARARAALEAIPPGAEPALIVDFGALWFDLDGDGQRGAAEGAADLLGPALVGWRWRDRPAEAALPVIRFDAADRHWLRAYTQLISGSAELILAFDPGTAVELILEARAAMNLAEFDAYALYIGDGDFADMIAILDASLRHQPDASRTRAAKAHWLGMIADNRQFWAEVAQETDNDREWIPNDSQQSALGIDFPQGLGAQWGAVLDDAEALLTGTRTIPHWRARFGISFAEYLENPAPIDIVGWMQGWAALAYRRDAPPIDTRSWNAFSRLLQGRTGLMMLVLN
ncbi:MAG: hypothetical protein R3D78_04525 [Paracoccaceae bacterium]